MPGEETIGFNLNLTLCERTIEAHVNVPNTQMRVADLVPILLSFDSAIVGMAADKTESDGAAISCRAGCGACCRQLVPISEAEAIFVAELIDGLPEAERAVMHKRFRQAVEGLGEELAATLRDTPRLDDLAKRRQAGEEYFRRGVPCPFLHEENCVIYDRRPASCREYLVTSPAINCATPSAETVQTVEVPVKLSRLLYTFGDGEGKDATRWLPLVLALEWAASRDGSADRKFDGPEMFKAFVNRLVNAG